jgi:hypothetical protein
MGVSEVCDTRAAAFLVMPDLIRHPSPSKEVLAKRVDCRVKPGNDDPNLLTT